jgi:hypothetical protein
LKRNFLVSISTIKETMLETVRFREMVLDVLKWAVVLTVVHVLWFFVAPARNTLLAPQFVGMFLFIISGLVTYWLVVDPYRNDIYPPSSGSVNVPDCDAPPADKAPHGVPDNFLKE